jgi:hypothetical protein
LTDRQRVDRVWGLAIMFAGGCTLLMLAAVTWKVLRWAVA